MFMCLVAIKELAMYRCSAGAPGVCRNYLWSDDCPKDPISLMLVQYKEFLCCSQFLIGRLVLIL